MRCGKSLGSANARRTLSGLLLALVIVLAARKWVCMPALVVGNSMQPTLRSGEVVLVNKLAFLAHKPRRGDLVCVRTEHGHMIKRVIGLPGELVAFSDGQLLINNAAVSETAYLSKPGTVQIAEGMIPQQGFGVIGDNRSDTVVAVVSRNRIEGRVLFKRGRTGPKQVIGSTTKTASTPAN
jgi:signal peptidase I